ncbi:uncharacterized protein LOC143483318, partial [Brachyhypopomus gauderio]|uniref:uncharacterized protein LOC143483318 n=1 Tax=Brachyhypopomus gauderio TaxID=698409 RepID=UPI0040413958
MAGLTTAIEKTAHLVMCHPLIVSTNHGVMAFINSQAFSLSRARQNKIKAILTQPHITYNTASKLVNLTDNIEVAKDATPHDCADATERYIQLRPELHKVRITKPGAWDLCSDGSCWRQGNELKASYAVVQACGEEWEEVESGVVPQPASAQLAEMVALTRALEHASGQIVNIYTDSAYVHGVIHHELVRWMDNGYTNATGQPIKHLRAVHELSEAIMLPKEVAVIKVRGHQGNDSFVSRGNEAADRAAKAAGGYNPQSLLLLETHNMPELTESHLAQIQEQATVYEKQLWIDRGATVTKGLWRSPEGRVVLPLEKMKLILCEAHGPTHSGVSAMVTKLECLWWHPYLRDHVKQYVSECDICQSYNVKKPYRVRIGGYPVPAGPFEEIVIDYTDMGPDNRVRGYRYLLVMVDRFTKWVEAIPTKKEDSKSVIKWLQNELIPRYGLPKVIRSDNGSHFDNKHLAEVEQKLGLTHKFGTVYHPQSQGLVERANQTIKTKLAKVCAAGDMDWVQALPLVLMSMRATPTGEYNLSPHQLMTGRPMPGCPRPRIEGPALEIQEQEMSEYMRELTKLLCEINKS